MTLLPLFRHLLLLLLCVLPDCVPGVDVDVDVDKEDTCFLVTLIPLIESVDEDYTARCEHQNDQVYSEKLPDVNLLSNHRNNDILVEEEEEEATGTATGTAINLRADCNMISLTPLITKEGKVIKSGYEHALAKILAVKHLTNGDGSLIQEVQGLNETCNIDFKLEFIDTDYVDDRLVYSPRPPCVFLGASSNPVTDPFSFQQINLHGIPIITGESTSPELEDGIKFPMMSQIIPNDNMVGDALIKYLKEEIKVNHLAVLSISDNYGLMYVDGLRTEAKRNNVTLIEFKLYADGTNLKKEMQRIKDSQYRYIYFIHYGNIKGVHKVMEIAEQKGVAGTGKHTWIPSHSLPEKLFSSFDKNSSLHKAYRGTGFFGANGRGEDAIYKSFRTQLQELKNNNDTDNQILNSYFKPTGTKFNEDNTLRFDIFQNLLRDDSFLRTSPVRDFSPYQYESIILAGLAACSAVSVSNDTLILYGKEFDKEVRNTSFTGISGLVDLHEKNGMYTISNLVEELYIANSSQGGTTESVEKVRFKFVTTNRLYENNWTEIEPYTYNDNNTTPLKDLPIYESKAETAHPVTLTIAYLFSISSILLAIGLAIWTMMNRKTRIVRASQPFFLLMICGGTIILASAIIPIAFDPEYVHSPEHEVDYLVDLNLTVIDLPEEYALKMKRSCTSTLWLCCIGIAIIFSALFSKAYRINKIMRSSKLCRRIQVRVQDTLIPLGIFLSCNIFILSLMTIMDPIEYEVSVKHIDKFRRPPETEGSCNYDTENHLYYLVPLLVLNLGMLCFAMYQSWMSRHLSTEFQESEQIFRALICILLVSSVGIPVLPIARNNKSVNLFLASALIFVICVSILVQLFMPKLRYENSRRSLIQKNGKWVGPAAAAAAYVDAIEGGHIEPCAVDSKSSTSGEMILSTRSRAQLFMENDQLRKENMLMKKAAAAAANTDNRYLSSQTTDRAIALNPSMDYIESTTNPQHVCFETSSEFLMESTIESCDLMDSIMLSGRTI